jgi:hypothetical protein
MIKISFILESFPKMYECKLHYPKNKSHIVKIIDLLDIAGFFSSHSRLEKKIIFDKMIKDNDIFIDETRRVAILDAEDIDEGMCIRELQRLIDLPSLKPLFMDFVKEKDYSSQYSIIISNYEFILWDFKEALYKKSPWHVALSRAIMAINEYLKQLNFSERVYYEYSGNDTVCVILSDAMKKILQNYGIITHSD